jgi:hypothetical protein
MELYMLLTIEAKIIFLDGGITNRRLPDIKTACRINLEKEGNLSFQVPPYQPVQKLSSLSSRGKKQFRNNIKYKVSNKTKSVQI